MVGLRDSGDLESDEPCEEFSLSPTYSPPWDPTNFSYFSPSPTYSPPWDPTNFSYFPPSPTFFPVRGPASFPPSPPSLPLYLQASPPSPSRVLVLRIGLAMKYVLQIQQHEDVIDPPVVRLAFFVDYEIGDRGSGELYVVNGLEGGEVINWLEGRELIDGLDAGGMLKQLNDDFELSGKVNEVAMNTVNELEPQYEDIVDQHQIIDVVNAYIFGIENRGGELEFSGDQALDSTTLEVNLSGRLQLGHRGQWVVDIRYGWNWLNIGTFKTAEGATLASESTTRLRGGKDLFDFPIPFLIEKYTSEPLQLQRQTAQVENQDDGIGCVGTGDCAMADQAQFNSGGLEKREAREKNPGVERLNKKANGVRIAIPIDDILQTKGMRLKDAAKHLKVSITKLKSSCRDYGIPRWPPCINEHNFVQQSLPKETPVVVHQEEIPQLTSHIVPSNMRRHNIIVEKEIPPLQFLPTAQQENPDACFGNDEAEAIEVGAEGTWEAVMEEAQLNLGCLGKKGKRKVNTPGGVKGNNRTTGVRIAIPKEDILQTKEMRLIDAAKHLEVSKSTLKRVCREYDIYRWPPRKEQELIGQSRPNKSPTVVDQEQIPQLNPDTLLSSNLVPAISDTYSVRVKVRCEEGTIMFRLSCPWRKVELEQQVKERLSFEAGTYKIEYKDEDDELILINCDKDLEECISSSSAGGSRWIELFLKLK